MPDLALDADAIRFAWPARRGREAIVALDGVSLRIERGEAVALLGPNGSGKSTLLSIVAGLRAPGAGRLAVLGTPASGRPRAGIGVVFQHVALDRHLSVRANLRDAALLQGLSPAEAAARVTDDLQAAGLADLADRLVRELSGGQARRADLCRALLHRPALLLLDEPTTGLDPSSRPAFLDRVLAERDARGMAVLTTTHLVDEAERHDRVVLMDAGRIVAEGTPESLRAALGARRLVVHDREPEGTGWSRVRDGWARPLEGDAGLLVALDAEGRSFTVAPPTLADVFEARAGRALDAAEPAA